MNTQLHKLSNGEVVVIDDLLPLEQQIRLYIEACNLPYHLVGGNRLDIQDRKPNKPLAYIDQHWIDEFFPVDLLSDYVSDKIFQAYINCGIHSENPDVHVDSSDKGDKTLLYYMNREWKHEWGGETILLSDDVKEIEYITPYRPGRIIIFDSTIPHAARQQSFAAPTYRFTLAIKFNRQ
jgi:hypothetical protein|tara:strand:+ start:482 stop:1018 length:537 start_codon:yes stop_codon:yes gene_type:complete